jgi:tetratricopeptide (TPR) repeat protein
MPFRSAPSAPAASGEKAKSWGAPLAAAAIVLAGVAAYANSLHGQLIYDDLASILDNPSIRHLWPPWGALSPPRGEGWTVEGRPVLNGSLAVNYAMSGTDVRSYHALNLVIHLLAGLTLFGIVRRTLERNETRLAFAVALLWTVHPLQTEAVTYVIQRAESLMGLFYLLTIYCFIRGIDASDRGGRRPPGGGCSAGDVAIRRPEFGGHLIWFSFSVLACLSAMGTKEVAATLPVMVFFYDRTFVAGSFREAWRRRWRYYLGLGVTWILLAELVIGTGGDRSGSVGFGAGVTWWAYALTQFEAIVRYLALAFWPHPLVFDYGPFLVGPAKAAPYAVLVAGLAGLTIWALFGRQWKALGFLGFFFFGILAVTSLVPGTSEMIVERRMYLPLAAVIVVFVLALNAWLGRRSLAICLILAVGFGCLTWRRNRDYQTDLTIWSDCIAKYPANSRAQYNLGVAFFNRGRGTEEVACYREALRLDPANAEAHHSLANALFLQDRAAEAFGHFQAALALKPRDARLRFDYGTDLFQSDRDAEAMVQLAEAIRLKPDYAEAHDTLGIALAKGGQLPEAVAQFREALRIDPGYATAHHNLGLALGSLGRQDEADAQLELAARLGVK